MTLRFLTKFNAGLIILSSGIQGELGWLIRDSNLELAKARVQWYQSLLGDRYYLEVQPHSTPENQALNQFCLESSKEFGIPLVATNDCHYSAKDDHLAQKCLICIGIGKRVEDLETAPAEKVSQHLRTADEMLTAFADFEGAETAIAETVKIAERCNLDFNFSTYYMPKFEEEAGKTLTQMMAEQAQTGLLSRLEVYRKASSEWDEALVPVYNERLEEELSLIDKMGFPGYFLVVSDFIVWAKKQGIPVGPGRGSCAGSLVAYALQITEVDPIRHKLLFERFLNPDRISLPDIDVDFCIHGRDDVIRYVVEKYGADRVAQIATFGTLKAKAAIKDIGRVLGKSYAETDKVAQLVPAPRQGFDFSLSEALEMEPRLKEYADSPEGQQLIELALKVEGLTRHSSTHAAGVVIGDRALTEMLPMTVDKEGNDVTQFSMKYVEKIGLVKFDFLGLKTLTVINDALKLVKESTGDVVDFATISIEDPKTYLTLCGGNTVGVFQLESTGITEMTMRLKPNRFNDLVAILALYRPGPLDAGMVDRYIERKNGREEVEYMHPRMESYLSDTYGIILYQEQIMQLAQELSGYSLGEADLLRRAMGKKIPEEMAKQRKRFTSGAIERGIEEKLANEIFDQMETFARYGFNRSHSAAYAMISFQTAYLKTHYPVQFMAALMSNEMDDSDKVLKNLTECRKQKIEVLPPNVNKSKAKFSVEGRAIRYGLAAVKGVGDKAVQSIIDVRDQEKPFVDLEDFVMRVDLKAINRRVIEGFIKCGAFDFSPQSRRELLDRAEAVLKAGQTYQKDKDSSQVSLFSANGGDIPPIPRRTSALPEWPINRKLAFEREALGFYISGHPLEKFKHYLVKHSTVPTSKIKTVENKTKIKVGGVVTALKLKNTKKGDRYATFTLEDWQGTVEALVWPDTYQKIAHLIVADDPVLVSGKADVTEERCSLIIDSMESLIELRDKTATKGLIPFLDEVEDSEDKIPELKKLFVNFPGSIPVIAKVRDGQSVTDISLEYDDNQPVLVRPCEELCDGVEQIFGRPALFFV
ncbi:MAG: DNA polymerase III subunit alpha [Bdellovibrionota bacterium]